MAKVNICNVEVLDNPCSFLSPFKFKITFECHEPLDGDLEWKLVYVSSAYQPSLDQTLDSILVGPIPVGRHQFVFETDPPNTKLIPPEDAVGVTVVLIQCLFKDKEFIRVGYYVNNEYTREDYKEEPPTEPLFNELQRNILTSDPRVTRFPIDWGDGVPLDAGGRGVTMESNVPMDDVMMRSTHPAGQATEDITNNNNTPEGKTNNIPCNREEASVTDSDNIEE